MVDAHVGGGPLSAAAAMDPRGAVFYRRHAAKFQSDARLSFSAWVAEPALAETDCVAEDAVRSKTVSRPVLPAICDLQGDFQKLQGQPIDCLRIS